MKIIINLPQILREEVKFRESPTVAVALTVSYRISIKEAWVTAASRMVDIKAIENEVHTTATALLKASSEILLLKRLTIFLPLTVERAEANRITIVTVLIPPAVPTGEPPINISRMETKEVAFVRFC